MMSLCLQPPLFHLRIVGHVKMARSDFFSQRFFHTRDLDPWICHPAPVTR